jgi:hypothetical protein
MAAAHSWDFAQCQDQPPQHREFSARLMDFLLGKADSLLP